MKAQMFNKQWWVQDTDPKTLHAHYLGLLYEAGFDVLNTVEHHFEPQGYTALFLLAESHLAIHTFPEEGKAYIELSSCVREQYDRFCVLAG